MKDLLNNAGFLALMGTIFGGAGLKIIESWLGKAKAKADQGSQMRDELRKDIEGLRTQLEKSGLEENRLESLIEEWRSKYYDLLTEKTRVVTELTIVTERLKSYEKELDKGE